MMGPIRWVRLARIARNPPPLWKVLLWIGIVAACGLIVAADWLFELPVPETDVNARHGLKVDIEILTPE